MNNQNEQQANKGYSQSLNAIAIAQGIENEWSQIQM
jgi:hypothetical protein